MAPIEKNLINKKILNTAEIKWINDYHKKVETNHCVKCDTYEEDQPDSRQEEIDAI